MRPDQERVRNLLTDTVTLLCKNGLQYQTELRVQGVLGITLDNNDVFIVHINEKLGCNIGGATTIRNDECDAANTRLGANKAHVVGRGETPTAMISMNTPTGADVVRRRRRRSHESSASPALATNIQRSIKRQSILKDYSLPGGDGILSSLHSVTGCDSMVSGEQEFSLIKVKTEVDNVVGLIVEQSQDVGPKMDDAPQNIPPQKREPFAMQNSCSIRPVGEILGSRQTFGDILDATDNPTNAGADCLEPPPAKWRATDGNTQESFRASSETGTPSGGGGPFITGIIRNETVAEDVALHCLQATSAASWDSSQMTEDMSSLSTQDSKTILDSAAGRSAWDTSQQSHMSVVNVTPHPLPNVSGQSCGPMVHCKRTIYRGTWSKDSIFAAIHAVREDNTSINKAAVIYKIPKTTLLRHLRKNADDLRVQACRFTSGSQNSSTSD